MSGNEVLVGAAQLRTELQSARVPPVVIDVRWTLSGPPGRSHYDEGHLPSARFVDLERDLAGSPGATGRHPLPEPAVFEAAMRRVGVDEDSDVVAYDEWDGIAAARAWWCLRYFGHRRVRVLDGGYQAWLAAGGSVQQAEPDVEPGDFVAQPGGMPTLDADDAARVAREGVLLDARAGERYRGEHEPVDPVAGHIPGALSAPAAANLGSTRRYRSAGDLYARFAALGVADSGWVGCYCGSGVAAAQQVLALHRSGISAALYVGSWSQWSAEGSRPVATGPEPG